MGGRGEGDAFLCPAKFFAEKSKLWLFFNSKSGARHRRQRCLRSSATSRPSRRSMDRAWSSTAPSRRPWASDSEQPARCPLPSHVHTHAPGRESPMCLAGVDVLARPARDAALAGAGSTASTRARHCSWGLVRPVQDLTCALRDCAVLSGAPVTARTTSTTRRARCVHARMMREAKLPKRSLTGVEQCPWKTLPTCASGQYPILDKVGQRPSTCGVEGAIVPSGGDAADEMRYM